MGRRPKANHQRDIKNSQETQGNKGYDLSDTKRDGQVEKRKEKKYKLYLKHMLLSVSGKYLNQIKY